MELKKLTYYNIHGFVIAVDEGMREAFDLEYWRFKDSKVNRADMIVEESKESNLPITLRHAKRGISINFNEKGIKQVKYESGVPGDWVLYTIEPFLNWKDKCLLHCGAVEKDGKAIIFPAEGGVGKTTMAMHLVRKGYSYLSDDWLIIGREGKAYPLFKTLHLYDYNLKRDGKVSRKILGTGKYYYNLLKIYALDLFQAVIPGRYSKIIAERLKPVFSVDVSDINDKAKLGKVSNISKVFWLKKNEKLKRPVLRKISAKEVAEKMPYITLLETNHFFKNYLQWAYGNGENEEIENRLEHDRKVMEECFKNSEVYELEVPAKIKPEEVCEIAGL